MLKVVGLSIAIFIGFSANAQIEEIRRITETLCSPELHGRGYVNKGDSIAAAYLVREFKKLGCEPYKDEYLQDIRITYNGAFPSNSVDKLTKISALLELTNETISKSTAEYPDSCRES